MGYTTYFYHSITWNRGSIDLYNEQYLLMTYLLGGAGGDEIVMPVHYIERTPELAAILEPMIRQPTMEAVPLVGGGFWMMKA